jgi:hypothetical protein
VPDKKEIGGLIVTIWLECNIFLALSESLNVFLLILGEILAKAKKLAHFGVPFVQICLSQT